MARIYKLFRSLRTVLAVSFVMSFAATASPVYAARDDVFTVKNVKIDVTAESAVAARQQALNKAQLQAFEKLAGRLLPQGKLASFTIPPAETIGTFIKDFEITDEQLSSVRYIGTYTFRFKNDAVRKYFSDQGLSYTDLSSKPVLVIPYYQAAANNILWGPQNLWLEAWRQSGRAQGLVPIALPIGDLQDVADLGDNEALTHDPEDLREMIKRYGAGEAIIMLAVPVWQSRRHAENNSMPDKLTIMLYRTDRGHPELSTRMTVGPDDIEGEETLFEAAVRQARDKLQQAWKSQTMVSASQNNNLSVRVNFDSMKEWIETQNALRDVETIRDMKIIALTPTKAELELIFYGSENRLRLALSQADMTLTAPKVHFQKPADTNKTGGMKHWGMEQARSSPLIYDLYLNKYRDNRTY